MSLYRRLVFPLLRRVDAEQMHDATLAALEAAQATTAGRYLLRKVAGDVPRRPVRVFGLTFPNVLGVAAGFDKDARVAVGLSCLGFGHVEVGTLTPYPQPGNSRPRMFRLPDDRALINRMGFPNQGAVQAASRLRARRAREAVAEVVTGVSLGKQKETPLAEAAGDYVMVMRAVYAHADYLAINVSSPNTPGLRELQGARYLEKLLRRLEQEGEALAEEHGRRRPLLLKIAPDLTQPEIDSIVAAAIHGGVAGIIATNTTVSRRGVRHLRRNEEGGLSGAPLAARSNEVIAYVSEQTAGALPVIGVGGVFSAADARAKLDAGAALVQVYTGLVYEGPGMAGHLLRELGNAVSPGGRTGRAKSTVA